MFPPIDKETLYARAPCVSARADGTNLIYPGRDGELARRVSHDLAAQTEAPSDEGAARSAILWHFTGICKILCEKIALCNATSYRPSSFPTKEDRKFIGHLVRIMAEISLTKIV